MDDAGTYYFEFDWSGRKIYGDRELQISFRVKQDSNYMTHWTPVMTIAGKALQMNMQYPRMCPYI